ncbi:MAG: hypothetical protein AAFP00_12270, partial [Bacteroidota bacterium]
RLHSVRFGGLKGRPDKISDLLSLLRDAGIKIRNVGLSGIDAEMTEAAILEVLGARVENIDGFPRIVFGTDEAEREFASAYIPKRPEYF